MDDQFLSVSQVAQLKGVSRNAVYKAVSEKRLPSQQIVGHIALRVADVEAWNPRERTGRRQGVKFSEETKQRISESQRLRWQKRKQQG